MPVTATGSEAGISVDRADVQISVPVDGDPRNASSVNAPLQQLANYAQRVRKKAGFLDLASTWAALQTFTHRLVVSRQGEDSNPALAVTGGISTDTLTASGAATVGSVASSGAVSGTTGTFSGAVSAASAAVTGSLSAASVTTTGAATVGGALTAGSIVAGAWIQGGSGAGTGTYGTNWSEAPFSPPMAFRLTPWGEIQFRGTVSAQSTPGAVWFTLPSTHWPSATRYAQVFNPTSASIIHLVIGTNGTISFQSGSVSTGSAYSFDMVRIST